MEIAPDKGWKRDPNTGLWVPDIAKAAEKIVEEPKEIDPKKYAKANCKFCHGCVVKRFPQGKKNTARLRKTEKRMQRR
jgi:hypothetical protein